MEAMDASRWAEMVATLHALSAEALAAACTAMRVDEGPRHHRPARWLMGGDAA